MGIRESLLNTITSVADSDFVRIVTSAGASSKATVRNLFKGFESNLSAKSSLTTSDYVRVVGSDNEAYKQSISNVKSVMGVDTLSSNLTSLSNDVYNQKLIRKIKNYSTITIPSSGYVKVDSFSGLGVSTDWYLVNALIRGWYTTTPYGINKGSSGTDFYLVGPPGTVESFSIEYFFVRSVEQV